ncbi:phosphatase domain-containing protein [Acidihalobacter prosperus]|uniref:Polynucleotide kinase PNKP phosphatase domain-containing protein n=1 Tax=Acidihalobacter prosperus TaxID=160660 RepID=A0A1A6C1M1_9GAMM|nr:hypothetical protein [Acidihalobacter prosperus]OBS08445.1 hypothetical protein Thpro_022695 [Acidihalobacter prosperus]
MTADAREIVICELDGVLALIEHRLHHLYNDTGERNWQAFHAACGGDMPNLPLIQRLNQARAAGTPVVLLSGRGAEVRAQTLQWLHDWQIAHDALWLRPEGDRRPALAFKAEVIERHYPGSRIRRVYESAHHLDVARWHAQQGTPCTLFGPNQGNGATREQFELKTVRHACEHVMLYPFYGDDDYAWEDRCGQLAAGTCLLCQAGEAEAERARQAAAARLAAQARGLPPLEGSERQVAWAEGVRLSAFGGLDKVNAWVARVDAQAEAEDPDHWRAVKQGIARAADYLAAQTEARWWIDHRHGISNSLDGGRALVNAVAEQEGYF